MSLEFYKTQAGRRFYDGTMTRIADSLERIATCLEEQQTKSKEAAPDSREMMDAYPDTVNMSHMVDSVMKDIADLNQAHVDKIRMEEAMNMHQCHKQKKPGREKKETVNDN